MRRISFIFFFSLSITAAGCGSDGPGTTDTGSIPDQSVTETTTTDTTATDGTVTVDTTTDGMDATQGCTPGEVYDCSCTTGGVGVQSCDDDGTLENCVCHDVMPSPDLLEEVWDSLDGGSDEGAEVDVASDVALDEGPPPPAGNWAKNFGSSGAEEIKAVAADSQGNVYVAGYFQETLTIGSETFVPIEPETPDSFVASFDRYGAFRWAHAFGASQADMPFEIEVDGYDKIYVAGSHKATMTVGSEQLVCNGSSDLYVVSYDADGNQLWAKSWGGDNSETPRDVSVNPAGDIFVTGSFQGSITADDITATGGGYNAYVLAIDAETHNALWITTFTGGGGVGTSLVADNNRNAMVAVSFKGQMQINDNISFDSGSSLNFDVGLIRLDHTGAVLWANDFGGPEGEEIIGMDLDDQGNVYITGVFTGAVDFGGGDLVGTDLNDIVLAAYSATGDHLWSRGFTGTGHDQAQDLEVAGDGIYVTGRFDTDLYLDESFSLSAVGGFDIFVARFMTANGGPVWAQAVGSTTEDLGNGVGIGGDGGIYVGGRVSGNVSYDGQEYINSGLVDAFLFRVNE